MKKSSFLATPNGFEWIIVDFFLTGMSRLRQTMSAFKTRNEGEEARRYD